MKKTSIYLDETSARMVQELAEQERASQAEIIRCAIAAYGERLRPDRSFAPAARGEGDGTSMADIPEEELLAGFGD